ncbi:Conserved_hypothetical protein [Hexamita inflata]|uniref:Uncharacterized protein n=1 Tax=Hexamita inflata TaxID=28002 RepID=A0AA86UGQ5_9EUKA|nr:Conserved hypothetical protein [Hexamita inflata]
MQQNKYNQKMIAKFQNKIKDNTLTLRNLQGLRSLDFIQNFNINLLQIELCTNIEPKLVSLYITELTLSYCKVKSLEQFKLDNLEVLFLQDSFIPDQNLDISHIIQYKKLKELYLKGFDVDISPLLEIKLLTILNIEDCALSDVSALKTLNLKELSIKQQQNIDITPLQNLNQLVILKLEKCVSQNVNALQPLINLKELYLNINDEVDISQLSHMTWLNKLELANHQNTKLNIQVVKPLTNLKSLDLWSCKDIDITVIQYLTQLSSLSLGSCGIINIDILRQLANLVQLYISFNQIIYIQPLYELKKLTIISAQNNSIIDIQSIRHRNFQYLLADNQNKPTKEAIHFANKLKDINTPITLLKYITQIHNTKKTKKAVNNLKVQSCIKKLQNNHSIFMLQIVSILQIMNLNDDCQ